MKNESSTGLLAWVCNYTPVTALHQSNRRTTTPIPTTECDPQGLFFNFGSALNDEVVYSCKNGKCLTCENSQEKKEMKKS